MVKYWKNEEYFFLVKGSFIFGVEFVFGCFFEGSGDLFVVREVVIYL